MLFTKEKYQEVSRNKYQKAFNPLVMAINKLDKMDKFTSFFLNIFKALFIFILQD